ncbi:amyloid beta A4 precursor protein-binding family B member 1-interacting protein-like, partial [Penaeus monodon]|uniref:amyloid beta A4 precursor protein-binding family B member 1-interacting protein-like n=1 Tax=Penaeus monodon TaxID=6687 RepID=UPI0018A7B806
GFLGRSYPKNPMDLLGPVPPRPLPPPRVVPPLAEDDNLNWEVGPHPPPWESPELARNPGINASKPGFPIASSPPPPTVVTRPVGHVGSLAPNPPWYPNGSRRRNLFLFQKGPIKGENFPKDPGVGRGPQRKPIHVPHNDLFLAPGPTPIFFNWTNATK